MIWIAFDDDYDNVDHDENSKNTVFQCKDKKINPKRVKKCGKIWSIKKRALTLHSQKAQTSLLVVWLLRKEAHSSIG